MNGFQTKKLIDLCSKIGSGATPRGGKETYLNHGHIFLIRSQNVLDFFFSLDGGVFISEEQARLLNNVIVQKDDVLINITGDSVARVCSVPGYINEARVNQHVAILRCNPLILSSMFLKYYLLQPQVKSLLLTLSSAGATRKALTKGVLENFEIDLPPLHLQQRIAAILSALDDKIELNRKMNYTLEEIFQACYKHHFVDDMDLENLPKGWEIATLGNHIDTISKTHKFPKPKIIFLNTSDVLDGFVLHSNYSEAESLPGQAKKSIRYGDILYSEIRPENRRFAFINFNADDYVVSTKLMVLRSKKEIDSIFFYFLLTRPNIIKDLHNLAEARSGTFPQITFEQINEIKFILPDGKFLHEFIDEFLHPTYNLVFLNNVENQRLISIRNTLLPKLISGELIPSDLQPIEQAI